MGLTAVLLALTACSSDDPAPATGSGATTATTASDAGETTGGAAGSGDAQEALRKVVDAAVDAANLADPSLLTAVLCEPGGPQKSTRIPAGALVELKDYPTADGDEVQADLEIAVKGESSPGKLVLSRKGDGWCVA